MRTREELIKELARLQDLRAYHTSRAQHIEAAAAQLQAAIIAWALGKTSSTTQRLHPNVR